MADRLAKRARTALCGIMLLLAACVEIGGDTQPSRFYVLSAVEAKTAPSPDGPAVIVGPVTLPRYLDRPQIVSRPSPNQLDLAEYDRWGGRLDDNFTRVLAQNLGVHLDTNRIAVFPQQRLDNAIQIAVDVSRFEPVGGQGDCELDASWSIFPAGRRGEPVIGSARIRTRAAGSDYGAIAAALSEAIDELSREIAAAARAI